MNAQVFAEWMRRQGYRITRTESTYWYNAWHGVLMAFPWHWVIQPSEQELSALMRRQTIIALRYSTPFDKPYGKVSYHVVLNSPYNLDMLRHQARDMVRRGLKNFRMEQISFKRLAEEGWSLKMDTNERQGRSGTMTKERWQRICLSAEDLPGFEAFGAIVGDELAAALLNARIDDVWYVVYAQSRTKFMKQGCNNAIFYAACCDLLSREGVNGIFFCPEQLDCAPSVDEFKFRMSFKAIPVRQRVVFNPLLAPIANRFSYAALNRLRERYPTHPVIAQAEGMVRFYLEGKLPADKQCWPECIERHKTELLGG